MSIFTEEQQNLPLEGITVVNGMIGIQLIERLLQRGNLAGSELDAVNTLRRAIHDGIEKATSVNYDQAIAQFMAQHQAQQAKQGHESSAPKGE